MISKFFYVLILFEIGLQPDKVYDYYDVDILPKYSVENFESYVYKQFFPHKHFDGYDEVYVTFVVKKDGNLDKVKVIRSAFEYNGNEVSRILETMPKWDPAVKDSQKVDCKMFVSFTIGILQ